MRILQLIDSLEAGGAERMAVNYANALADRTGFAALVASRKEGELKEQIAPAVEYLFLEKKNALDPKAILRLRAFCRKNKIELVHAHSSSFFLAVLLRIAYPKVKIVWHDHYGLSDYLENRKSVILKSASVFFSGIISVNDRLAQWAGQNLLCKKVLRLNNFMGFVHEQPQSKLNGKEGCRVICLANWRPQKNIMMLLQVAQTTRTGLQDWTFHLVGKDFDDDYSRELKSAIEEKGLQDIVFAYGSVNDVQHAISQSDIAVLTSRSEGLPVALLEYGFCAKPVIATAVGDISKVVRHGKTGLLVPSDDVTAFSNSLVELIHDPILRSRLGNALHTEVAKNYSKSSVIEQYLTWLKTL